MSLWLTITGNSSLPISPANNFWDHLNNQIGGDITLIEVSGINLMVEEQEYIAVIEDDTINLVIDNPEYTLVVDDTEPDLVVDDDEIIVEIE